MSQEKQSIILKTLDNENKLSERADQKAISMLSILGVFMVFFIVYFRSIPINYFTIPLMIIYLGCALIAIYSLVMTIRPRIKKEKIANAPACDPAFFAGICQFPSYTEFKKAFDKMASTQEELENNFSYQIYSVARINSSKYKHLQRGMLFVVTALGVELTVVAYLFLFYASSGAVPLR
jgi:hypothetical protein